MNNPIDVVYGNRVYLKTPVIPKSNIQLTEGAKQELIETERKKFLKLEVYMVGDAVKGIEPGDFVMVDPMQLANLPTITISDELTLLITASFNISHKWKK